MANSVWWTFFQLLANIGLSKNMQGIHKTWGRWSDIIKVRLSHTASFETYLENILSIMVCEWPVTLVGVKYMANTHEKKVSESINSFAPTCISYLTSLH